MSARAITTGLLVWTVWEVNVASRSRAPQAPAWFKAVIKWIIVLAGFLVLPFSARPQDFVSPSGGVNSLEMRTSSGAIELAWRTWQIQAPGGGSGSGWLHITVTNLEDGATYTETVVAQYSTKVDGAVHSRRLPLQRPGRYRITWLHPYNFLTYGIALQEMAAWEPAPVGAAITVDPPSVTQNEPSRVEWITNNAATARVYYARLDYRGIAGAPNEISSDLAGFRSVELPSGKYRFSIVATGRGGESAYRESELHVLPIDERVMVVPITPSVSVSPLSQSIAAFSRASLTLARQNASWSRLTGSNGTSIPNPSAVTEIVAPASGVHTYEFSASGFVRFTWVTTADAVIVETPDGTRVDVTHRRHYDAALNGTYTFRWIVEGVELPDSYDIVLPTASVTATVTVTAGPVPRTATLGGGRLVFGDEFALAASSNGDGAPVYSVLQGPGTLNGARLSATAVGTVRVRADYPATAGFTAASAEAEIVVDPRPVNFTLADQVFDFDGLAKAAVFTASEPAALVANMVELSRLRVGPDVGIHPVTISAHGNYTGRAEATVRILPVIEHAFAAPPPPPEVVDFDMPSVVQWPARGILRWATRHAGVVEVGEAEGGVFAHSSAGDQQLPLLDAREAPYRYAVEAHPVAATASFAQRGATHARLQGPSGLDLDVTGRSQVSLTASGRYTYTVSANGLSRTATFNLIMPPPAQRAAALRVTPATVRGIWADRSLDGPYRIHAADSPSWVLHTGETVTGVTAPFTWRRADDGAAGSVGVGDHLLPGTQTVTAQFLPPNTNYAPATATATWRVTVPISVHASHAAVSIDGNAVPGGYMFRALPGTSVRFSAAPHTDYDWGTDWEASASVWSGSGELLVAPASAAFTVKIPAGTGPLSLTASAFQVAPRVTALAPLESNHRVTSGPAAGRSYPRCWAKDGMWFAYLGRDGVAFEATGQVRESAVAEFELQARAPQAEWTTLLRGSPSPDVPNGPRVPVSQRFSVKLGDSHPQKPLLPAAPGLAGTWHFRVRARSQAGQWSAWSAEVPLSVVMPVQTVHKRGRTLPPVDEADWYEASEYKDYAFQVLVP